MWRGESGGAVPRRFLRFRWNVPHAALFAHALFCCRQNAFFFCASGGPISSSSGRKGEKNAAKNQWFLAALLMQWEKVPQGIGHGPTLAAADVVGS